MIRNENRKISKQSKLQFSLPSVEKKIIIGMGNLHLGKKATEKAKEAPEPEITNPTALEATPLPSGTETQLSIGPGSIQQSSRSDAEPIDTDEEHSKTELTVAIPKGLTEKTGQGLRDALNLANGEKHKQPFKPESDMADKKENVKPKA